MTKAESEADSPNETIIPSRIDGNLDVIGSESPPVENGWLRETSTRFAGEVWQDWTNFYDWETLGKFGLGLGAAAVSANTTIDGKFDSWFQHHVRSTGTDAITHNIKWVGDGTYTVPIAAGFFVLGNLAENMPYAPEASTWGSRTLRGYAVGVIPMLAMQQVLGSDRPGASPAGSHWTPFVSAHGVSGDAFMGGVPFLAAAGMTDNRLAKAALYVASIVPALGRIDYDAHYLSQAALGWFMAYLSVMAVNDTDEQRQQGQIVPILQPNQWGIGAEFRW